MSYNLVAYYNYTFSLSWLSMGSKIPGIYIFLLKGKRQTNKKELETSWLRVNSLKCNGKILGNVVMEMVNFKCKSKVLSDTKSHDKFDKVQNVLT